MNPILRTATVLSFVAAGFAGCSSTSVALKEKWRDPAAPDWMMKKALVLAVHEEIWMQAKFEREMQARLKEHGVETIAAVDVLKSNEKLTRERFAKTFADLGIDAVVVSRVAGVKEDITIAAPTYTIDQAIMKGFYSYYDYAYMSAQVYESCFSRHGLRTAQILLTHDELADRKHYLNARFTLSTLLKLRVIPVINENDTVATDEIKFGDNDTLGALVTNLVEGGLFVILTDQAGLYTADPRKDPGATLLREAQAGAPELESMAGGAGSELGKGGMLTQVLAAKRAARSGAHTLIASGREPQVLMRVASGEHLGSFLWETVQR